MMKMRVCKRWDSRAKNSGDNAVLDWGAELLDIQGKKMRAAKAEEFPLFISRGKMNISFTFDLQKTVCHVS